MNIVSGKLLFLVGLLFFSLSSAAAAEVVELGNGVPNLLRKLEEKRDVHVAFLGGSITQNAKGHSKMVPERLEAMYPDVRFRFTNAGLSSTCSLSGAYRVGRDVLALGQVDLLVVEFAVNDDQDAAHSSEMAGRGLEGVVRQYLRANPDGDVISVQFVNPPILEKIQKGEAAISVEAHKAVARHYGISSVDIGQALADEIEAGRKTWKEDYGGTHPNQEGYQFASEQILKVIAESSTAEMVAERKLPESLHANSFEDITLVNPQDLNWLGGWQFDQVGKALIPTGAIREDYTRYKALRSDGPGDMLYYNFLGTSVGAFILAGPDAGALEVSVDGGEWQLVETYHRYSKGLNYPRSVVLADELAEGYHQLAIRTSEKKMEESKGHAVNFLFFAVGK